MRLNRILTGMACMLLLAGIGSAVELFGGNTVLVAHGAGGSTGGPYLSSTANDLELGVQAHAWVVHGPIGDASAAFNGSGSVSRFQNLTTPSATTGFLQAVSYSGRVQTKVNKTVADSGTVDAAANVYARSSAYGTNDADASAGGSASIYNSIDSDVTGTADAVARGSASYSSEYINKSMPVSTTSIKATGGVSGENYLTAQNKKNTGNGAVNGSGSIYTDSIASANKALGSYTDSYLFAYFHADSGAKNSANTISGFVNATKASSYAWDTNRMNNIQPSSTNYNAYSGVAGVLDGVAKAFENKDSVTTSARIDASASHDATDFVARSSATADTNAVRLGDNNATRVEGSVFISNAISDSITQGRLGAKALNAESSFKTLGSTTASGAGDNIGAGIFLSNKTSRTGFGTHAAYTQSAIWDDNSKQFGLLTGFEVVNNGQNFTTHIGDTGAIGTVLTIMNNAKPLLNATYGTMVNSTNMGTQKNWNWYASTNGVLNQGGVIDVPQFVSSGTTPLDSQTYILRQYTRAFDTSNPG
jgi:hypothetical protein